MPAPPAPASRLVASQLAASQLVASPLAGCRLPGAADPGPAPLGPLAALAAAPGVRSGAIAPLVIPVTGPPPAAGCGEAEAAAAGPRSSSRSDLIQKYTVNAENSGHSNV